MQTLSSDVLAVNLPEYAIAIFTGALAFVVAGALWAMRRGERKRLDSIERFATLNGLRFRTSWEQMNGIDPNAFPAVTTALRSLRHFDDMLVLNIVSGDHNGKWVALFEGFFGIDKRSTFRLPGSQHETFTFALVEIPTDAPETIVEPRVNHPGSHYNLEDVDFESEQFNIRYEVRSADALFAATLITPKMTNVIAQYNALDMTLNIIGKYALFVAERQLEISDWGQVLRFADAFNEAVPSSVTAVFPPKKTLTTQARYSERIN